jgi:hypothetical protein
VLRVLGQLNQVRPAERIKELTVIGVFAEDDLAGFGILP